MDTTMTMNRGAQGKPVAVLSKLTAGSLAGLATMFAVLMGLLLGELIPPVAVLGVVALVFAGLIMLGFRWAPALGALLSGAVLALYSPVMLYDLRHPEESTFFAFMVVTLALLVTGIVAGITATVQNYRHAPEARHTPRGLAVTMAVVAGLLLGAIGVAALPKGGAGVSDEVLQSLPAVTTEDFEFAQKEIRVKAGEQVALHLQNKDKGAHSFDIDELNVHAFIPVGESKLALFKAAKPGTYTFYCGVPGHANKAAGTGMVGKLIVE